MNAVVDTTETAMLGRVIRPEEVGWSVEAARAILEKSCANRSDNVEC